MFTMSNYKILNQSVDLLLGNIEDKKLEECASIYRRRIFESKALLLRESPKAVIGVHAEWKGAGTSLVQKVDSWVLNFGFSRMNLNEVVDMLSNFKPVEKILKDLTEEVGISLYYLDENYNRCKGSRDSFLHEIFLTPPAALIQDKVQRLFQIKKNEESMLYVFKSLNGKLLNLDDCAELIQNERINAEEIFIPSLSHWLNSIKSPALVAYPDQGESDSNYVRKKKFVN